MNLVENKDAEYLTKLADIFASVEKYIDAFTENLIADQGIKGKEAGVILRELITTIDKASLSEFGGKSELMNEQ